MGTASAVLMRHGQDFYGKNPVFFDGGPILYSNIDTNGLVYKQWASPQWPIGTRWQIGERTFHYAKAGATALVAGTLQQSATLGGMGTTNPKGLTIATASVAGAKYGYATLPNGASDGITANLFTGGWYTLTSGSAAQGAGQSFQIRSHAAGAKNTSVKFNFFERIPVLISTSATASLHINPYKNLIQVPVTTATGTPMGVPLIAVTANYYFWLQTYGPCPMKATSNAITVGTDLVVSIAAGCGDVQVAGASSLARARVGRAIGAFDASTFGLVYLELAA